MKTTLPERSEHMAERLAAITEVIRELMGDDLAMLLLFGSYARGDFVNDRYVEGGIVYTYESAPDVSGLALLQEKVRETLLAMLQNRGRLVGLRG